MEPTLSLPWWRTDEYIGEAPIPKDLASFAGPTGLAIVRAFEDGRTDKGWGLPKDGDPTTGFMYNYARGRFKTGGTLHGYTKGSWNFAFIMRSMSLVCIDIDGKNGGLVGAGKLGALPHTMAETSKSGDGYHLFYAVPDHWDRELGYARFSDKIGIEQGVDFRGTGCVYHHPQQRWNGRKLAMIPEHLANRLLQAQQLKTASTDRIAKVLATQEDYEVLMLHDELKDELAKPIPSGRRNNTIFAIGSQMKQAEVPDWQDLVHLRATSVGLSDAEATKIVENIDVYA